MKIQYNHDDYPLHLENTRRKLKTKTIASGNLWTTEVLVKHIVEKYCNQYDALLNLKVTNLNQEPQN